MCSVRAKLVIYVVLTGCGRLHFNELGDVAPFDDGRGSDGRVSDVLTVGCWPRWHDGSLVFAITSVMVPSGGGSDPSLSGDQLSLYHVTQGDLYVKDRTALADAWGPSIAVSSFNAVQPDLRVTLSGDDLTAILASERGGANDTDLWTSERPDRATQFPAFTTTPLAAVNDAERQIDPELSLDGLRLYYARLVGTGQQIGLATRSNRTAPWVIAGDVPGVNITSDVRDPSLSPDERVIAFSVNAGSDLYYAVRPDTGSAFQSPTPIPGVNSAGPDGDAEVSADGCELYFSTERNVDLELYLGIMQ